METKIESKMKDSDKYKIALKEIKDLIGIQCADGNWNYDSYMHGLANGLLFAESLLERRAPDFLQAPKQWLEDKKENKGVMTEPAQKDKG